jgi:hypothetical protein
VRADSRHPLGSGARDNRGRVSRIPPVREWLTDPRHRGYEHRAQIAEYEEELDRIYPHWRVWEPFKTMEDERRRCRVQWLLRRRSLLLQGKDWGVMMTPLAGSRGRWSTNAITPPRDPVIYAEYRASRLFAGPEYREQTRRNEVPLAVKLHRDLGLPLGQVVSAIQSMPPGATPEVWVRHYIRAKGRQEDM